MVSLTTSNAIYDESLTGIAEIDALNSGLACGTLGRLSLFRTPAMKRVVSSATKSWTQLEERLATGNIHDQTDLVRLQNYFLLYPESLSLEIVFESLKASMGLRLDLALCIGKVEGKGVMVFIRRRAGMKKLPDLIINDIVPLHFQFRRTGAFLRSLDATLECFSQTLCETMTNLVVKVPPSAFSFEQIMTGVSKLTQDQLETLRGEALVRPQKERSEFQSAFLRVFGQINKVRDLNDRVGKELVFNAFAPPSTIKIPPLENIIDMDLQGCRLQEVSGQYEFYTLREVFSRSSLLNRYAVLILGANKTTGYGKSAVAKALACHYAKCFVEARNLPHDRAQVVLMNTLDSARDIKFVKGMVWVLDEFKPADTVSNVYCTETMLKCLFNPAEPCTLRARNVDIKVCDGIPRIITSNADSLENWCGSDIECSDPLKRKCIVFVIRKPLLSSEWVRSIQSAANLDLDDSATDALMAKRLHDAGSSSSDAPFKRGRHA